MPQLNDGGKLLLATFRTIGGGIRGKAINLVDQDDDRNLHPCHLLQEFGIFVRALNNVGHVKQNVGVLERRL